MQRIAAIAAISENHAIGKNNKLLWSLPDDWANFHRVTAGKPFIMGRKSYQAEDALISDYRNVILTSRELKGLPPHTQTATNTQKALALLKDEPEIFILGGGSVFKQMLPLINYLYLTIVHHTFQGDTYFPEIDWSRWQLVESVFHPADERHKFSFSLNEYKLAATGN